MTGARTGRGGVGSASFEARRSNSSPKTSSESATFSSARRVASSAPVSRLDSRSRARVGARVADPADDRGQEERRRRPWPPAPRSTRLRRLHRQSRSIGRGAAGADRPVFEEALQVVGQRAGRRVAMAGLARDRLQDDRLQVAGDGRVEPPRPGRLPLARRCRSSSLGLSSPNGGLGSAARRGSAPGCRRRSGGRSRPRRASGAR